MLGTAGKIAILCSQWIPRIEAHVSSFRTGLQYCYLSVLSPTFRIHWFHPLIPYISSVASRGTYFPRNTGVYSFPSLLLQTNLPLFFGSENLSHPFQNQTIKFYTPWNDSLSQIPSTMGSCQSV